VNLEEATDAAELALIERFGTGRIEGKIRAHVVAVEVPSAVTGG
jgi:hypothetical protein